MEGLEALYGRVRLQTGTERGFRLREKPFKVAVRPFAGVRGVILDEGDHFMVRISDLVVDAPPEVHESLARLLIGKIDRRLASSRSEQRAWRLWARSPEVSARHDAARAARGRKRMAHGAGRVHDLDMLFERLNHEYFGGGLKRPRLGWTLQASRSLYGHHDPAHDAIVINRRLDHPRVPEEVVASILHHEMLHLVHGVRVGAGGRRIVHPKSFRRDEAAYRHHAEAKRFLADVERGRIRLRAADPEAPLPRLDAGAPRSWLASFFS